MITWIQVILQKHHKVVFTVLLAVIIVAFVFTIGSAIPFLGSRDARTIKREDLYGYNLNDAATMRSLSMQATVEIMLSGGRPEGQILEAGVARYAYLSSMAQDLGIRTISQDDIADYIQNLPGLKNPDGSFNPDSLKIYSTYIGVSEDAFWGIMVKNAIADKVEKLLAGPGYAIDGEVMAAFKDAYGKWDVEIAHLSLNNFNPEIAVDEAKLKEYFNSNAEAFRIPASVALDVAFIPAKAVDANAAFSDEEITRHYTSTLTKYSIMKDGSYSIKDLADVRNDVIEDLKKAQAARAALVLADDVATKIYDANAAYDSDAFKKILAEAKIELRQLDHIRPSDTNFPEGVPMDVLKAGYALGPKNFSSDPVQTEDGAWLVFFRESKESYIPEFAEVKEAVERRFKFDEKNRLFSEKGTKAAENIKAAVKDGKKFEDAAKAEGFTTSAIGRYSFADKAFKNESMIVYNSLFQSELPKMKAGDVSPMITRGSGGYIVYAAAFEAPKADANSEDFKQFYGIASRQALANSMYSLMNPVYMKLIQERGMRGE